MLGIVALLALVLAPAAYVGSCAAVRWYVFRRIEPGVLAPRAPVPGVADLHAGTCGRCHREIYAEWRGSVHGVAMTERLFRADYLAQGRLFVCLRCHAPLDEQQPQRVTGFASLDPPRGEGTPNPRFDPALLDEGVTCVICHQQGATLAGPIELGPAPVPHPTRFDPRFADNDLCRRCHEASSFPGADVQRSPLATFEEHDEYRTRGGTMTRCVDCHFPAVERPIAEGTPPRLGRRHSILGARSTEFVRAHLGVDEVRCAPGGDHAGTRCSVRLTNRAGHRFPTGEPGRDLAVVLESAQGARVGEAHIVRHMVDRIRLVERPGADTTLLPMETRTVEVSAPGPVATVSVEFCLFERGDPLLALARVTHRELCRTLARWDLSPPGPPRALPLAPEAPLLADGTSSP